MIKLKSILREYSEYKKLILLVGPPAIGKSTWIENNYRDAFIINRDDIVNEIAKKYNFTYDDLFFSPDQKLPIGTKDFKYGEVIKKPEGMPAYLPDNSWSNVVKANNDVYRNFAKKFPKAIMSGKDIVVDMTLMSKGARKGILKRFKDNLKDYYKMAVVFNFEGSDVQKAIQKIADRRAAEIKQSGGSKTIAPHVFAQMYKNFEEPTKEEGFDEILSIDDRERILKALETDE